MDDVSVFAMSIPDDALPRQREQTVTYPTCSVAMRVPADEDGDVP